ncbi:MAG TPA: SDR family oxidoreductase [Anaerolineae bacterium]|nr:SDR family oxidoreductase [Anaerolineae bacterium]
MRRFEGQVALITGASRGIGRGIALCLAEEGANIVVHYRTHPEEAREVAEAVEALGGQALLWQADVADRVAVEAMFEGAARHFGRIDIAVANAAMSVRQLVVDADWEGVRRTIEVSQFGVFHTCQFAAQQMIRQEQLRRSRGKIIIISSIHAIVPVPGSAPYNMAKAAINHLARTLAAELTEHHINVNIINPGWIDTPGERKYATEEEIRAGAQRLPWKRLGTIEDIGKAAAFLASDDADYITGATLLVDGGFVLGLQLPSDAAQEG